MLGAIRSRDILSHPVITVRSFGWRIFFRAVFSGRNRTFLSTLYKAGFFQNPALPVELEEGLRAYLDERGLANLDDIIGKVKTHA